MRHSLIEAALLAGTVMLGPTITMGQQFDAYAPQDPYLQSAPGELTPPLVPPAPFEPGGTDAGSSTLYDTAVNQDELAPAPPALEDFPETPGMISDVPDYRIDGGYAPYSIVDEGYVLAPGGGSGAGAIMPQMIAPNMIGDFFGPAGGSLLSFQTDSIRLSGPWRHAGSNELIYFPASGAPGNINLTSPLTLEVRGDANAPIPAGTVWTSADPQGGYVPVFDLAENPVETAAVNTAYPDGAPASFVSGHAEQNPDDADEYAIYTDYIVHQPSDIMTLLIPAPGAAPGAFVGRQKIAQNSSPIPRSRVFVNYSFFDSAPLSAQGVNVNRVTPGFEWAFLDDNVSIEVRTPFASTLDSDVNFFGRTSTSEVQFGNVTGWLKGLMWESDQFSWSAGVGMTIPTAEDFSIAMDGQNVLQIENTGYHVLPFLGFLWTPTERCFAQGFLQFDVDASGNSVYASSFEDGLPTGNLSKIGEADDATYAFIDLGLGYWLYRNRHCDGFINGFAPTIELHYNAATEKSETVRHWPASFGAGGARVQVGTPGDLESTNLVLGMTAIVGTSGTLTLGYATNVGGEEVADNEFRAYFNWFFGPQAY